MKHVLLTLAGASVGGVATAGRLASGVLCLALLAGCATNPAQESAQAAPAAREEPAGDAGRGEANPAAPAADAQGSHIFRFERMSVALSDAEKAKVVALAERARAAKVIVIRGYCDRKEVGNARDAAIARATAVRSVLAQAGIAPAAMRVRYNTERNLHAAEIEFQ